MSATWFGYFKDQARCVWSSLCNLVYTPEGLKKLLTLNIFSAARGLYNEGYEFIGNRRKLFNADFFTEDFRTHYRDDLGDGEEHVEDDDNHDSDVDLQRNNGWSPKQDKDVVLLPKYYSNIENVRFRDDAVRSEEDSDTSRSSGFGAGEEPFQHDIDLPQLPSISTRHDGIAIAQHYESHGLPYVHIQRMEALRRIAHNDQQSDLNFSTHQGMLIGMNYSIMRPMAADSFYSHYDPYKQQYLENYRKAKHSQN